MKRLVLAGLALALVVASAFLAWAVIAPARRDTSRPEFGEAQEPTRQMHGTACGVERWDVKTLADPAAAQVAYGAVRKATIPQLTALPSDFPTIREAPTETTVYQLTGTHLVGVKLEADSDFHLVLRSPLAGHPTMIAEIPSPACVAANPDPAARAAQQQAASARDAFLTETGIQPGGQWWNGDLTITLKGVGFLDRLHGQTGVAPNGIELHPVLFFHEVGH